MTCKSCIHYSICKDENGNTDYYGITYEELCSDFKDKSKFIELPCKVGEEIYVMNRENIPQKMILEEPDIRCHCAKEDNLCMALCDNKKHGICAYRFMNDGSDIGKKVFLTREEALKGSE